MRCQRLAHEHRVLEAALAGAGIGVAGIHHQRLHIVPQVLAREDHRRGAKAVLREDAGDAGR